VRNAVEPHHLGIGRSLIDEQQPGRIEQSLFRASSVGVPALRPRAPAPLRAGFFNVILCRWKNR
jgi:hypothetical protein